MFRIGQIVRSTDERDDPKDFYVVLEPLNSVVRVAVAGYEEHYVYRRYHNLRDATAEVGHLVKEVEG